MGDPLDDLVGRLPGLGEKNLDLGCGIQVLPLATMACPVEDDGDRGADRIAVEAQDVNMLLPSIITGVASQATDSTGLMRVLLIDHKAQFVQVIFGMLVILLLIFAPGGIAGMGAKLRARFLAWRSR